MKLKLLPIWKLKVQSKMDQIKKESRRFPLSSFVVKPPFCILSARFLTDSSRVHPFIRQSISTIMDPDEAIWLTVFCETKRNQTKPNE